MKKIGKQVLYISCTEGNDRNGEASFARLKDGAILHAYTRYGGGGDSDDAVAQIAYNLSYDEGETWSESRILFPIEKGEQNNMSPALFRMANGSLGVIYDCKTQGDNDAMYCMPVFRHSEDEGKTWSGETVCASPLQYMVMVNDCVTVLASGRIVVPLAICRPEGTYWIKSYVQFAVSDDNGESWHWLPVKVESDVDETVGLQEPGIYENAQGRLWLFCRTCCGYQYQSFSEDGGLSWSKAAPNFFFSSPDSPMRVKKVAENTVAAVFNPVPFNVFANKQERWGAAKRTPLCVAVSRDDGASFDTTGKSLSAGQMNDLSDHCYLLEDDLSESYCYPAVIGTKDGFLVSYYHSGGTDMCLHDTKVVKVTWDELK